MSQSPVVDAFLRYVAVPSQSAAGAATLPSTPGQRQLAELLAAELRTLGLADVHIDANGILTATLPGTTKGPHIGFVAHLDTVDIGLSPEIHPQILHFDGKDVCLNRERDIWMRAADHPELAAYVGQDILFTDGTSVLGADNKAAIAVIMTLLGQLVRDKTPHGPISVAFVPDEEVGMGGSKNLDLARFPVDFAYTIDACALGEVVWETFVAGAVRIDITGVTAHPMSSKGVLVSPVLVATDIINCLDRKDTPEHTDGRQGFIWVRSMQANARTATVTLAIRDFDKDLYQARKDFVQGVVNFAKARNPKAAITCTFDDIYGNIAHALGNDRRAVDLLLASMEAIGVPANPIAMRGGTDGSVLSARGVPTPNYFTGAHNFHSITEFLPLPSLHKALELSAELVRRAAR